VGLTDRGPLLHFVRHGQSTWNLEHRVQGQQAAPELTDLGRQQSADAAAHLTEAPGSAVVLFTSDLPRAVGSAEIIGRVLGITPLVTPLLREQSLGSLEGLTTRQATVELAGVDLTDPAVRYGGGESRDDVAGRVRELLGRPEIGRLGPADGAVLVSHGDTIRIAIADLLGEDLMVDPWRAIGNGSITTVRLLPPAAGSKDATSRAATSQRRARIVEGAPGSPGQQRP